MLDSVIMNRVFRFCMTFHGYFIACCTVVFSAVIIATTFLGRDVRDEPYIVAEEYVAVEKFSILLQLESALWLCASVLMVVGLYKQNKKLLIPFMTLFIVDGALVFVQETVNVFTGRQSDLSSRQLTVMILVNVYVLASLVVLYQMFASEPPPSTANDFVRFENDTSPEPGGLHQVVVANVPPSVPVNQQLPQLAIDKK